MIIACPHCLTKNRIDPTRAQELMLCGKCKHILIDDDPINLKASHISAFLKHTEAPIIIDFWAAWCGPCRTMAPHFKRAAEESLKQGHPLLWVKINTEEAPSIARKFNIQTIPTLVYWHQQKELKRHSGVLTAPQLLAWAAQ